MRLFRLNELKNVPKMLKSRKVRVIEGLESDEFRVNGEKSEIFFVEMSKPAESESLLSLDDWLFLGNRKSQVRKGAEFFRREGSAISNFFAKMEKKGGLP